MVNSIIDEGKEDLATNVYNYRNLIKKILESIFKLIQSVRTKKKLNLTKIILLSV